MDQLSMKEQTGSMQQPKSKNSKSIWIDEIEPIIEKDILKSISN